VFLSQSGLIDLGKYGIDDELLKRVEQVALVAGLTSALDLGLFHQIVDKSTVWKIDWIRTLAPADTTVLYAIGVKR
jgi:hypothetical protein